MQQQHIIASYLPWILWRLALTLLMFCGIAVTETNSLHDLPDIVCGNTTKLFLECFQNSPELFASVNIPITREQVVSRCKLFTRGIACTNRYLDKCSTPEHKRIVQNEIYGANKLYEYLCDDMHFQREFLKNKQCFVDIQKDWSVCEKGYKEILKELVAHKKKDNLHFMDYCCARAAYEDCSTKIARYKCRSGSYLFVAKIAEIISTDKRFGDCKHVEKTFCSSARRIEMDKNLSRIYVVLIPAVIVRLARSIC
ncbi:uncharacterized protein LOC134835652 [Culicoides brevitarsis]|uniref:uncharacterized protein LOC134835652 n=1 Tax=Culicoides brevitarsis TaxID=469753 RepID=UPI00307C4308